MSNLNKRNSNVCCDRYRKHSRAFKNYDKNCKRIKKVVVSKKNICSSSREEETSSTVFLRKCQSSKPLKNTTKSDITFTEIKTFKNVVDCCKKCGDMVSNDQIIDKVGGANKSNHLQVLPAFKELTKTSISKNVKDRNHIYQYYRNEQFHESSDSFYATEQTRGASLKTIIEHPEKSCSQNTVFKIYSNKLESEVDFIDPDNIDGIKKIKEFRNENYFECHSAKSRISSNNNTTALNHKCVYRFYLNDRLFPVPINSDHQENVRCIECQLPLKNCDDQNSINGTIQAKVKLNNKVQDMMLMLPVKDSLIIKERRKAVKSEDDSLYFGIIKLNLNGDSIFNRNVPSHSLALRYQKGYEEHSERKVYNYGSLMKDDVIII